MEGIHQLVKTCSLTMLKGSASNIIIPHFLHYRYESTYCVDTSYYFVITYISTNFDVFFKF